MTSIRFLAAAIVGLVSLSASAGTIQYVSQDRSLLAHSIQFPQAPASSCDEGPVVPECLATSGTSTTGSFADSVEVIESGLVNYDQIVHTEAAQESVLGSEVISFQGTAALDENFYWAESSSAIDVVFSLTSTTQIQI